jgi:cation diffusion facilitator family transporter
MASERMPVSPSLDAAYSRGQRITLMGLVVNVVLAGVKLVAGVVGHSYALVADAIESMTDVVSSLIVWGGLGIAARPADDTHPYGHGKAEPLAALVVVLILGAAAVGIAAQAVRNILTPHELPAAYTLVVLLVVVIVKEALYWLARRAGRATGSGAVAADAWHHRSDAITSAAAAIGIAVALWRGPGSEAADDYAALVASLIIAANAVHLVRAPLFELMDAAPPTVVSRARAIAAEVPRVAGVEKVLARKSGLRFYLDMHVEVDPEMPVRDAHALAHDVKDRIRSAMPEVQDVLVHVEPFASGR